MGGGPTTAGPIRTLSEPGAVGGFQAEEGLDPTTGASHCWVQGAGASPGRAEGRPTQSFR